MAAHPPFRERPRARPGSLDRPVNGRMYRGTWLLVGIPLLAAAFTVGRPQPLARPTASPEFDFAAAAQLAQQFADSYPKRAPGSPPAKEAAAWVAEQLTQYGFGRDVSVDRFHAKIPGRGRIELENVLALRPGPSNQVIAVVAHRDNSGTGPGANDNASGTAALLELARAAAPGQPAPKHTLLFLSTDGGVFGGLGAQHFAEHSPYRGRIAAVVNLDSIAGSGPARLIFNGDRPRAASAVLLRTANERIAEHSGPEPSRPSTLDQLLDLAFPFSFYEQAPFVDKGITALTLTSAGDRPPSTLGDTPDRLNRGRLRQIGQSAQELLGSLDDAVELAEGTSTYVYLGSRVVRGPAIVFILCAALLPCFAVIVDLFARLRRRHIRLAPALRSYRTRLAYWLFAMLLFELFAAVGIWQTGAARPLVPESSPGTQWPAIGLILFTLVLAVAWFAARDRLIPRSPLREGEVLAGQVGALLALAVVSLLMVAMNPYSVLLVLPSLHAWIWLPQLNWRPRAVQAAVLVLGFAGPLLLVGSFAGRLDLGLDAPWYLAQLAAVGYVPLPSLLVLGAWLAVAAQLTALVAGRYAPYPTASERPRLGPGRRVLGRLLVATRRRQERARARSVG